MNTFLINEYIYEVKSKDFSTVIPLNKIDSISNDSLVTTIKAGSSVYTI